MNESLSDIACKVMTDLHGKMFIADLVAFSSNTYLQSMGKGVLPKHEWQRWGVDRYNAAKGFVDFLYKVKEKAVKANLSDLAKAVDGNIREEEGFQKTGSHEEWRQKFYAFLEISPDMLTDAPSTQAAEYYQNMRRHILDAKSPWVAIGALMTMENAIAQEMQWVEKGLKNTLKDYLK